MGRRIVREYRQRIDAPPAEVFPLLCPVREADWLDGWRERCRLVQSASGVAETGAVFVTTHRADPETTWVITRHDPVAGVVEFSRVCPGVEAVTLSIHVVPASTGSFVAIRYGAVPLPGADHAAFDARWERSAFERDQRWWERSMNHYLHTGSMLRHA